MTHRHALVTTVSRQLPDPQQHIVVFGKTVGAKMPNEPSFTVLGGGDGGRALENPEYGDVQGVADPVRSEYEA